MLLINEKRDTSEKILKVFIIVNERYVRWVGIEQSFETG